MEGIKRVVQSSLHRQEVVAGGMWQHLLTGRCISQRPSSANADMCLPEYTNRLRKLGDHALDTPMELLRRNAVFGAGLLGVLNEPLKELPQVNGALFGMTGKN